MAFLARTVTIAAGGSLSGSMPINDANLVGLQMPAGWDAAAITFQGSADGGTTWKNLYRADGTEESATVAADRLVALDLPKFSSLMHVRLRSGTLAVPVVQTVQRDIVLLVRE